jgi:hypothetical protein
MLLGYPEMMSLGASLKATRGSISSLPDGAANDRYLYDAVTNAGNSGGPVCDDKGNVIAVHYLGINTASRYGGGIPSPKALEFLKASLPDYKPQAPTGDKLDWPQVDEKVSPSTMLIWVRKKNAKAAASSIGSDLIELPVCLFCSGAGDLRCAFPGCNKGVVTRSGQKFKCPSCDGKGGVDCKVCSGVGIDVRLASVQRVLARVAAAKSGGSNTSASAGANTSTNAPPAPPTLIAGTTPTSSEPAKVVTAGNADLLALIDCNRDAVAGAWGFAGDRLEGGSSNRARLQIPYTPPAEYDVYLSARMVQPGAGGSLIMGLISGDRQFYVAVREDACGISAGGTIDNQYQVKNLDLGVTGNIVTFQICVRRNSILVRANKNQIFEYRDDQSKLSVGTSMQMPNARQLFVGTDGANVKWSISGLRLYSRTAPSSSSGSSSSPPRPTTATAVTTAPSGGTPADVDITLSRS